MSDGGAASPPEFAPGDEGSTALGAAIPLARPSHRPDPSRRCANPEFSSRHAPSRWRYGQSGTHRVRLRDVPGPSPRRARCACHITDMSGPGQIVTSSNGAAGAIERRWRSSTVAIDVAASPPHPGGVGRRTPPAQTRRFRRSASRPHGSSGRTRDATIPTCGRPQYGWTPASRVGGSDNRRSGVTRAGAREAE